MATNMSAPDAFSQRVSQWCSRPSQEVVAELERFCAVLHKWQPAQNLVSRETLDQFWERHAADSLQAATLFGDGDRTVVDLGSGGGFPAIPLAIVSKDANRHFHLVESNSRKCAFLREVSRQLELSVTVHNSRIEKLDSRETGLADIVTARALAGLSQLLGYIYPLLKPGGRAVLHKGRDYVEEVDEAGTQWEFDVVKIASETDPDAVLLDIRNIRPRP